MAFAVLQLCHGSYFTEYDRAETNLYAQLSFAAYCIDGVQSSFNCYWCVQAEKEDKDLVFVGGFGKPDGANIGFVAFSKLFKKVILVFRGTDNEEGWTTNLSTDLVTPLAFGSLQRLCPEMKIHKGFLDNYVAGEDQFIHLYFQAHRGCKKMNDGKECRSVFTGHSLGGWTSLEVCFNVV